MRAIRIGYAPREQPLARGSGDVSVSLAMVPIPPVLAPMRVSETELCPGSADRGPAFQLWEQARTGLLAMVVARDAKPAAATTLVFERNMGASGRPRASPSRCGAARQYHEAVHRRLLAVNLRAPWLRGGGLLRRAHLQRA